MASTVSNRGKVPRKRTSRMKEATAAFNIEEMYFMLISPNS
jgi:hypothetical protein